MSRVGEGRSAVAIGGGTGLPLVLRCLLSLGFSTSAVVTMADDGGSTGVLRRQLGILPPGDIRNCLVSMAADPDSLDAQLFQYRFAEGEGLAGHALGNLILAALADLTGSFPAAIEHVASALDVQGRVLPSTLADAVLHATDRRGEPISGQARIAQSPVPVARVCLEPEDASAYEPARQAIEEADVIVIGPGSLYTSIIPNFLVEGIAAAVRESKARRVYVCNVANMRGETSGLNAADHVEAVTQHGLAGSIDVALVNVEPGESRPSDGVERVVADASQLERIVELGARPVGVPLADSSDPVRHDRAALCEALEQVLA
ncbi:MAG: YvcK family protein [Coriobacteriales bacterium]|nr:YvcK family protein [Coriobacteriales bacterium]